MKALPVVSEINVTPMVDVMLVLLIIFMVITPMLSKGENVDMVKTHNPVKMQEADKEDAIIIAVTRDGKVFLSPGQQVKWINCRTRSRNCRQTDRTKPFILKRMLAPGLKHGERDRSLRTVGVDQLGLLTEQIQDRSNQPDL